MTAEFVDAARMADQMTIQMQLLQLTRELNVLYSRGATISPWLMEQNPDDGVEVFLNCAGDGQARVQSDTGRRADESTYVT